MMARTKNFKSQTSTTTTTTTKVSQFYILHRQDTICEFVYLVYFVYARFTEETDQLPLQFIYIYIENNTKKINEINE